MKEEDPISFSDKCITEAIAYFKNKHQHPSLMSVAKKSGYSYQTVRNYLKKYGIKKL